MYFETILIARGQELRRVVQADSEEEARNTIAARFPSDMINIVIVHPLMPEDVPYPPKQHIDGLGIPV